MSRGFPSEFYQIFKKETLLHTHSISRFNMCGNKCWRQCGSIETLLIYVWECKLVRQFAKQLRIIQWGLNIYTCSISCKGAVPLLMCPQENCVCMYSQTPALSSNNWKQPMFHWQENGKINYGTLIYEQSESRLLETLYGGNLHPSW